MLHAQPIHLAGELVAEFLEQVRFHQVRAQPAEDRGLQCVATDVQPVIAGALVARRRAAEQIFRDHAVTTATAAAVDQTGKEMARTAPVIEGLVPPFRLAEGRLDLPRFYGIPQILFDDPQFRHLLNHPFGFRIEARDALTGIGILEVAQAVPDQTADIHLIVEDAIAALPVAMDGGWSPFAALRTRNAVAVQFHGDRARGLPARVIGEDPSDRAGLLLVDGPVAPDALPLRIELAHHVIAIGITTAGLAVLDPPAQPSPDLFGEILKEQGVHGALEPDMQVCDIALGQGDDPHPGEGHPFEQAGDIFLIARQPVHRFGQHDGESAACGVLDQFLYAGAEQGGTRDRPVGIAVDDRPALLLRVKPAQAQLILD